MAAMSIVFCVSWDCVKTKNNIIYHSTRFQWFTTVEYKNIAQNIVKKFAYYN